MLASSRLLLAGIWLSAWPVAGCSRGDAEVPKAPKAAVRALASVPVPETIPLPPALPSASSTPSASGTPSASSTPSAFAEPGAPSGSAASFVLAAGGDVNFGRECGQEILKHADYDPFAGLSEAWSSADARFANLESQLSEQGGETQSPFHRLIFTGPPGGADVLSRARISLVSTANNHAWDYGKGALLQTIDNLERAGVGFAGTGRDLEQAYRPYVLRANGLTLAVFAVTHVWNQPPFATHPGRELVAWADLGKLEASIARARREHDFVVVSYHGGEEYVHAPTERVKSFATAIMALGVDALIGHHPHVPQGVGFYEGKPIVYSLGDLVFAGHRDRPWTLQSFFARLTLRKGAPPELAACPFAIDGHRPRSFEPLREQLAIELFRRHLLATSVYTGGVSASGPDELGCLRVSPRAAPQSASSSN